MADPASILGFSTNDEMQFNQPDAGVQSTAGLNNGVGTGTFCGEVQKTFALKQHKEYSSVMY